MRFWRITNPNYEGGDYSHIFINGMFSHPYGLPGITCDVCEQTWAGSRVLPIELPNVLQKRKPFKDAWPISVEQHEAARAELRAALAKNGVRAPEFLPGDELLPGYLDIPSRPEADFLWPQLNGPIVSGRIKRAFESWKIDGLFFAPINLRKVGDRPPILPAPIPNTGEPEDIINEVSLLKNHDVIANYYEIIVLRESGNPPGGDPVSTCAACGRQEISRENRQIVMLPTMWRGDPMFRLATTLFIMVSDDLRILIEKLRPTNVVFTDFTSR